MTKLTVEQISLCRALENLIKAIVNGRSYNDDLLEDVVLCAQKMMDKETALRDQFAIAALREIAEAVGDPSAYWIARKALEGKDD